MRARESGWEEKDPRLESAANRFPYRMAHAPMSAAVDC